MATMLAMMGYALLGSVGAMWLSCKLRLLPAKAMQIWFGAVLAASIIVMAVVSFFFDKLRLLGVPFWFTKILCSLLCRFTFSALVVLNPQIRVHIDQESWKNFCSVPGRSCVTLNHTSFFDAWLFVGSAPWKYIYNAKTLMKDSLRKLPVFGSIFDRVGHFPVYFKHDEDGKFSVDAERQAPVSAAVQKHLNDGGRICLFPEGQVNKDPKKLMSFRRGTFATIMDNKLPVYYFVSAGNEATWPPGAAVGGLPTDIVISVKKFDIDFEKDTAIDVAERLQAAMQKDVDKCYAARAKLMGTDKTK